MLILVVLAALAFTATGLRARLPDESGEITLSARDVVVTREGDHDRVSVTGWPVDGAPGAPLLPVRPLTVELPAGKRAARVVIEDRAEVVLPGPYRPLPAVSRGAEGNAVRVEGANYSTGVLDAPVLELNGTAMRHGTPVADLTFHGVRWRASDGALLVTTSLRYRLELEAGSTSDAAARLRPLSASSGGGDPGDGFILLDPRQYPSLGGSLVEYLIVTPDSLASEFQRLADWRTRTGTPATVRTLSDVLAAHPEGFDLQEKIRLFIRDAHDRWGTRWVLLGADNGLIPMRNAYIYYFFYPSGTFVPTDLYYSSLEGNWNADGDGLYGEGYQTIDDQGDNVNLYPDVYVGRAPVQSVAETATFINKVLAYQRTADPSYVKRALFAAEVVFPVGWAPGQSITLNGCDIAHEAGSFLPAGWDTLYLCEWPNQNETLSAVVSALNSGYHLVTVVGHGDAFKWEAADHYFTIDNALAMTNNSRFSVMFYANCNTNETDMECLNEYMLLNPTGGSIGSVATTDFDFPDVGRFYQQEFYRLWTETTVPTLGELAALMKEPFVPLSRGDNANRWTQLAYDLLGDPALPIWRSSPAAITMTHAHGMSLGDSTYTVTVKRFVGGTPVADARVTLWQPAGGAYARGTTNASGVVTLPFRPDVGGLVRLTATPANFFPAVDSFQVSAAQPVVALDGFIVDDDSLGSSRGNGDGLAEPGERIELAVTLRNAGADTTGALNGRLALTAGTRLIADLLVDGVRDPGRVLLGNNRNHIAALPCTLDVARSSLAAGRPDYAPEAPGDTSHVFEDSSAVRLAARAYIWQDVSGWHFRTAGALESHAFTGWVHADGAFRSLAPYRLESSDVLAQSADSAGFSFAVNTQEAEDGFDLLPSDSAFVRVVSDSAGYGSLTAGATATRKFMVDVEPGAVDHHHAHFDLTATTASRTRRHDLDLEIHAPAVDQLLHAVNDSLGGDNDRVPEPGETVELRVTLQNRGSGAVAGLSGTLRATSGAAVIDSVASWGNILAGAQGVNLTPFRMQITAATILCQLTLTAAHGESWSESFDLGAATRPPAPVWSSTLPGEGSIELTWTPVSGADLRGYNLYAGTTTPTRVNPSLIEQGSFYRVTGLTPGASYTYRLAAVDSAGNEGPLSLSRTVSPGAPYQAGWPVLARNRVYGAITVADVNLNGTQEVLCPSRDWKVYAWNPNGTNLTGWPKSAGEQVDSSPAAGDVDGNGSIEVFFGCDDHKMYAWNAGGSGYLAPSGIFATRTNRIRSAPTLYDLDGDGKLEIIFGDDSGKISVFRWDGSGFLNPDGTFATVSGPVYTSAAVADIDADGHPEIVVTSYQGGVYAWNHDGTPVRLSGGLFRYIGGNFYSSPALGDVDGNGSIEVVVAAGNDSVYVMRAPTASPLSGWPKWTGSPSWASPALGDLDGDGKPDIVVGNNNHNLYAWKYTGTPVSGWPVTLPDSVISSPVIGDITGDGSPDVVVGCADSRIYAYRNNGVAAAGWPRATADRIYTTPAIADLDGDGDVEVICGSFDGFVYAFDLPVPYVASTMKWPMFHHDRQHTGWAGWVDPIHLTAVPGGGASGATGAVTMTALAPPSPNPVGEAARISFAVKGGGPVSLAVYDVAGRRVDTIASGRREEGRYEVRWRPIDAAGRRIAPGVYFLRLEHAGATFTRKLVISR